MLKCKQLLSTVLVVMLLFTSMVFAENENGVFDTEAILNSLGNVDVKAGNGFSAILKDDGTVWIWGLNNKGQLGNGTYANSDSPVVVPNLSSVTAIAAGREHFLALKSDGTVWTWGSNGAGQLGNNTTTTSNIPVQVKTGADSFLSNIVAIDAGEYHSMALKSDGTVWTWGNNANGRLGIGTQTNSSIAVQVIFSGTAIAISAGSKHSAIVKNDNTVMAWGYNSYGQLGISSTTTQLSPVAISGLSNVSAIDAGANHTIVLKTDGTVWGWGRNDFGQLGNGTYNTRVTSPAELFADATDIVAGENVSFFIKADGIFSTGYGFYGQLGQDNLFAQKISTPAEISIKSVNKLFVGTQHVLAINDDNYVLGWGNNTNNQLDGQRVEKKGLPRILTIVQNDSVGNTFATSKNLTSAKEKINFAVDYNLDVDMYKISPSVSGELFLLSDSLPNITIKVYGGNTLSYESTNCTAIDESVNVVADQTYYISIEAPNPVRGTMEYCIIESNKILTANITGINGEIVINGISPAGANKELLIRIYDPANELINIQNIRTGTNGVFNYSFALPADAEGTYQVLVSGQGTSNVIREPITVGVASVVTAIPKSFDNNSLFSSEGVSLAAAASNFTSVICHIKNNAQIKQAATVFFWQLSSNGVLRNVRSFTMSIKPQETAQFRNSFKNDTFDITDRMLVLVCESGSYIPVLPAQLLTFSNSTNESSAQDNREKINSSKSHSDGISESVLDISNAPTDELLQNVISRLNELSVQEISKLDGNNNISYNSITNRLKDIATTKNNSKSSSALMPVYAGMSAAYEGEYEEGLFQTGNMDIETNVTSYDSEEREALLIFIAYNEISDSSLPQMVDIQLTYGYVQPFIDELMGMNIYVDDNYYNECDYVKTFTWESFSAMQPYGKVIIYTKDIPTDNFVSNDANYAPRMTLGVPIHGKINAEGDNDLVKIKTDFDGGLQIYIEPAVNESGISVEVFNEQGSLISQNEESIDVFGGNTYFIRVSGNDGTSYDLRIEQ